MSFLPDWSEWIRSHMVDVPKSTAEFCGDLSGLKILDVGCGDMIADVGLLGLGVEHITGLDVLERPWDVRENAASEIAKAGFSVPTDYKSRLTYVTYSGRTFPFPDNYFDFVFSWSAFEHIPDVPAALQEIQRVVKPFGHVFIQVYPWFTCFWGSHITDYIQEPFFHLTRSPEWVRSELEQYVAAHPEKADLVLNHMWMEYERLNRYSARDFLSDVLQSGFSIERMRTILNEEHAAKAPATMPLTDVISCGTMLLMHPAKSFSEEERASWILSDQLRRTQKELEAERAIRLGMQHSKSWLLTQPLRMAAQLARSFRQR